MTVRVGATLLIVLVTACAPSRSRVPASGVLLITVDTLRADRVGAYGARAARTPSLDALARDGARFDRAWSTAPITLTAHASLLSGRYPPSHGARHNGMAMQAVPTLATALKAAGFSTAAFVSAFPLDRRFGLATGFDEYDDALPRGADGRPLNERAGTDTVARAVSWLQRHGDGPFFLWVHLFEPHAPYGTPGSGGDASTRYDDDITAADRAVGTLLDALGPRAATTLVVAASDHGEAFGEHGEIGHSIFVYDTTLRVPLIMRGPGVRAGTVVGDDVSLVDVAPTIGGLTGTGPLTVDGRSLVDALEGRPQPARAIYAESFAAYFDFGWASLRAVRDASWKYIAAPKPELYAIDRDPGETINRVTEDPGRTARLDGEASRWSPTEPGASPAPNAEAAARLQSLGYLSGGKAASSGVRPDPKDRITVASRLATVTSGEVTGEAMIETLHAVLADDPGNPQAHLRLGFAELERGRCADGVPHLRAAVAAAMPSADAGLGLASCLGAAGDLAGARAALMAARAAEPGNPVVAANLGLLALQEGQTVTAVQELQAALQADGSLLEARFGLARALARAGDREGAAREASRLLNQLPPEAPQRGEVLRLLAALK